MANYEARIRVIKEENINIANNTSFITVAFEFRRTDYQFSWWNKYTSGTNAPYWKISVDDQSTGNIYFTFDWKIPAGQWKEVGRRSFTVRHTENGSKTVNISGYVWFGSGIACESLSVRSQATLKTIPRASTIKSVVGDTIGGEMKVTGEIHSSSFTHTLWYKVEKSDWINVPWNFTIDMSMCNFIPNSTEGTLQLCLRTMQGNTQIGGDQYKNVKVKVPSNVVPSINEVAISEADTNLAKQFSIFVQTKSRLNIKTAASGTYRSTIKSISVECESGKYNGDHITTSEINSSGTLPIIITVMDSRGRTASLTKNISVAPYHAIQILEFSAKRCSIDGVENDEGTNLNLKANFNIAPIENTNTKSYVIELSKDGGRSWTQIAQGSVYAFNGSKIAKNVVSLDFTYKIRLKVSDFFSSMQVEVQVGTSFSLIDFNATGKGIAFGKASEKNAFEVALDSEFNKPVQFKATINGHKFQDLAKIEHQNEMNFVPPNYNDDIHVNYTTSDDSSSGQINAYKFRNGSRGFSDIWAKEFCDQNGKGVFATLNNLINQIGGAVFQSQAHIPNNQRPTGFSGYCRFIKIGNAVPGKGGGGDTYYIMIDSGKNLYAGVQLNGGANISWRKI